MTINKLAITLNSPDDWEPWITRAKSHATAQHIWEFIDPENPQRTYLSDPTIPTSATVRQLLAAERTPATTESTQTAPTQPDLTDAEVAARLKIETIRYKHNYQAYLHKEHALDLIPTIIQISINRSYLQHTYHRDSAYEMLVALKRRVAPVDFAAMLDLRQQYKYLMKPSQESLDTWVNKWEDVYHRGTKLNMPEVVTLNPHIDFLDAIQNVLPHFYAVNQDRFIKQAKQNNVMGFIELLNLFRDTKRIHQAKQGKALDGYSVFATPFAGRGA